MTPAEVATRDLLLDTAEAILATEGLGSLGVRAVARRAGLSHNAPLRHFTSLAELRTAVATRGFVAFTAATADAVAVQGPSDPVVARAERLGRAYVRFALDHPGRFALMWRFDLLEPDDAFVRESRRAYTVLAELVGECQRAGLRPDLGRDMLAAIFWTSMHGIASLWPAGPIAGGAGIESLDSLVRQAVRAVLGAPVADPAPSSRSAEHPEARPS
jgi:AcrR family transcriptional regulator